MLSHTSLQGIGHQLGELWDLGKIASIAVQVPGDAELTRELGVTTMALIWMISIDHYVCPTLHRVVLGMDNTILSDLIGWIDK
jgi:hypothetical protein